MAYKNTVEFDNYIINGQSNITKWELFNDDSGLMFNTTNNLYILRYIDNELYLDVLVDRLCKVRMPLKDAYNKFLEIKNIEGCKFAFYNIKFEMGGKAKVTCMRPDKYQITIRFESIEDKIRLGVMFNILSREMSVFTSSITGTIHSKYKIDQHHDIIKCLSPLYILNSRMRNSITAFCLPHLIDTYFNRVPNDVLKIISEYVI